MITAQLLAIVEVSSDERVRCQAPDCKRSVFRRIHVVHENSGIRVYGETCFEKLFLGLPVASLPPRYTNADGRKLTDEERQLLIENTERLIQRFEAELQAEAARKADLAKRTPILAKPTFVPNHPLRWHTHETELSNLERQAKENVRTRAGIDPDLPGWRGLVDEEIERIRRENRTGKLPNS